MEEILLNIESKEIRYAHLRNGLLHDLIVERKKERQLTGNIYRGRVTNILRNIQSAFIDIGEGENGFIHISDIVSNMKKLEELYDKDKILENALYALKIEEGIPDNKKGKMAKKLPYMTKIMEIFGFKDIMDRESKIKCTEEILKRMESTGYLEHEKHDEILRLFNKQIKSKTKNPDNNDKNKGCTEICDKSFCQKNYTKIFNVILSNYGIKLENTRKSIMKKGITRWEYVYYLSENISGITNIIKRYQTS